jgi:hypothetical protein
MTNLSVNPSVSNNAIQNNWRQQGAPQFDIASAAKPPVDAKTTAPTTSSFASFVPSNSNTQAPAAFGAEVLAPIPLENDQIMSTMDAPKASAATDGGNVVDPKFHSLRPQFPTYHHNPYVPPTHPHFAPKPWSPGPVVGNAHARTPVATPTPFTGVPNAIAHKPFGHSSEITSSMQWMNFGNPHINSNVLSAAANVPKHGADAFLKYASGNESAYNFNPTATTHQIAQVLNNDTHFGSGFNSVGGFQDTINRKLDTFNFNRRIEPGTDGISLAGALALGRDGGANLSPSAIGRWAGADPWGNNQVISAKEAANLGLQFDHKGDASISQFVDIARRLEFQFPTPPTHSFFRPHQSW